MGIALEGQTRIVTSLGVARGMPLVLPTLGHMLKYWLILIASIGIVGYSSYAALFFGWVAQSTNDNAMADRAKSLADIWSFVSLAALVIAVACIARLIQLRRRRKLTAQSL